jgi:hypothetical protein
VGTVSVLELPPPPQNWSERARAATDTMDRRRYRVKV